MTELRPFFCGGVKEWSFKEGEELFVEKKSNIKNALFYRCVDVI